MITVNIRKQGGAAVITIPSDVLKLLNVKVGEALALDITSKGFVARPLKSEGRKRFTVAELLHGVDAKEVKSLNKKTQWAREGKPVGREII